jgi:hypothetical protein
MTIGKYEQTLADQSRHIIESDDIMKPILEEYIYMSHPFIHAEIRKR